MPLESATYISDLDPTNPVGSSDLVSSLDDHMRLVKATLQTTFPGIAGAVTATHTELNFLDGVTGTTGTGKLVLDDAPTIDKLTVTSSITLPAASVADAALSNNVPLKNAPNTFTNSPLTIEAAIPRLRLNVTAAPAGQKITSFDRVSPGGGFQIMARGDDDSAGSVLLSATRSGITWSSLALAATSITLNGVNVSDYARKSQENTFLATTQTVSAANANWIATNGTVGVKIQALSTDNTGLVGTQTNHTLHFIVNNTPRGSVRTDGSFHLPIVATSTSTALAAGQVHAVTGNATLPNMAAGQWVGVINNSNSPITVTKSASDTMYWTASGTSVTSVTIAARGKATFFCADGGNVYASGNIIGSS